MRQLVILAFLPLLLACSGAQFESFRNANYKATSDGDGQGFIPSAGEGHGAIPPGGEGMGAIPPICPDGGGVRLMAGQHIVSGAVHVSISGGNLVIDIRALPTVLITETHVQVTTSKEGLLSAPGSFPLQSHHSPGVTSKIYEIPLSSLESGHLYIKVHAVVQPEPGRAGVVLNGEETAWAEGTRHGVGWAMYFEVSEEVCE